MFDFYNKNEVKSKKKNIRKKSINIDQNSLKKNIEKSVKKVDEENHSKTFLQSNKLTERDNIFNYEIINSIL